MTMPEPNTARSVRSRPPTFFMKKNCEIEHLMHCFHHMSNAHLSSPGVSVVFMMQELGDDKAHCEPIDSVILSARGLWTHPLHSEDDVLFPLLLHRYNRLNFHRSEPLCDMERWAGMGSGRKHWLPHGQNSDARFEPQFRYMFGSHLEVFLSMHSRP